MPSMSLVTLGPLIGVYGVLLLLSLRHEIDALRFKVNPGVALVSLRGLTPCRG